ncbi:redoxin domain-containing protein [Halobacillus sp. Marseille-Q1614]|uniref:redoxin domain-containing protein n=1 Tax=Halobacillus sp. Marseille-Q1614 TaxID=2709134 RepID=UPI0015714503|nr:redoxin domain-containing protein [Halobacillus sp. Marseille-Q1614]
MKKWIVVAVMTALFGWAIYDYAGGQKQAVPEATDESEEVKMTAEGDGESNPSSGIQEGETAPEFTLETLEGETVKLSDYRGEKVLVNFWATWCPPCRAEMPDMQKFYEDTDIEILAVNLTETESSRMDVDPFVQDFGLTFPILMDKDLDVMGLYQVGPVPTSVFIDPEGKVQSVMLGAMNYDIMMQRYEEL